MGCLQVVPSKQILRELRNAAPVALRSAASDDDSDDENMEIVLASDTADDKLQNAFGIPALTGTGHTPGPSLLTACKAANTFGG